MSLIEELVRKQADVSSGVEAAINSSSNKSKNSKGLLTNLKNSAATVALAYLMSVSVPSLAMADKWQTVSLRNGNNIHKVDGKLVLPNIREKYINCPHLMSGYHENIDVRGTNRNLHHGLDYVDLKPKKGVPGKFIARKGRPVYAPVTGIVTYKKWDDTGGRGVGITEDKWRDKHNNRREIISYHLARYAKGIRVGTRAIRGVTVMGYLGNTRTRPAYKSKGRVSSGPMLHHLHMEVRLKHPSRKGWWKHIGRGRFKLYNGEEAGYDINQAMLQVPGVNAIEGTETSFGTLRAYVVANAKEARALNKTHPRGWILPFYCQRNPDYKELSALQSPGKINTYQITTGSVKKPEKPIPKTHLNF